MILVGSLAVKLGINKSENNIHIYSYNVQKNDNCYASQSINKIKINFNYEFNANKKADIAYNYSINGELIGKVDNNEKEIWNRKYNLSEDICENYECIDKFCVNKDVDINYEEYKNLVKEYEKEYGIKINAVLKVRLNIYFNINSYECNLKNEKKEDCIEIEIPITNTVTEIIENYENTSSNTINNSKIDVEEVIYYAAGGVILLGVIVLIIRIIIKREKCKTDNEKYEKKIKKILKYYKALIVTVKDEPNLNELNIMNIVKLEDLVDLAEQNEKNIIHYKFKDEDKSILYVIVDEYVYIYEVTS